MTRKPTASKSPATMISYKHPVSVRTKLMQLSVQKRKHHLPLTTRAKHKSDATSFAGNDKQKEEEAKSANQLLVSILPLPVRKHSIIKTTGMPPQQLPLSLGRKNLAKWWWQACPVCLHSDLIEKMTSKSSFCHAHCMPAAKEVGCLSKEMIKIDAVGELHVVGKNRGLVQIEDAADGRHKDRNTCIAKVISIGSDDKDPIMKFRVEILIPQEQYVRDEMTQVAPEGYMSTRKRKKNIVTPSPQCKKLNKVSKGQYQKDGISADLSQMSSPPEWVFPANDTIRKLRQAKARSRKRNRVLQFRTDETEANKLTMSQGSTKYGKDIDQQGITSKLVKETLPPETTTVADISKLLTPRCRNLSTSRFRNISRACKRQPLTTTASGNRRENGSTQSGDASDSQEFRCSPAQRQLFKDPENRVRQESTLLEETQGLTPRQTKATAPSKETTLALCMLSHGVSHGIWGDMSPRELDSTENVELPTTQTKNIMVEEREDVDRNQEMAKLLLALKTEQSIVESGKGETTEVKNDGMGNSASVPEKGCNVLSQTVNKNVGVGQGLSLLDYSDYKSRSGSHAANPSWNVLMESRHQLPKQPSSLKDSDSNIYFQGKSNDDFYHTGQHHSAHLGLKCIERETTRIEGKESQVFQSDVPSYPTKVEHCCEGFSGILQSQNLPLSIAPRYHGGKTSDDHQKTAYGMPHDPTLRLSQQELHKSSVGGSGCQRNPQISRGAEPSQRIGYQFSGPVRSDEFYINSTVKGSAGLPPENRCFKLPSVSFRGLRLSIGSQTSGKSSSVTQISQAMTPFKSMSRKAGAKDEGVSLCDAPTLPSANDQAKSSQTKDAFGLIESESQVSEAGSCSSSILSMPCCDTGFPTQSSLVVLDNGNSQLKSGPNDSSFHQMTLAGEKCSSSMHENDTGNLRDVLCGRPLRFRSSRALAKIIAAKNMGAASCFWVPTLLDDMSFSSV